MLSSRCAAGFCSRSGRTRVEPGGNPGRTRPELQPPPWVPHTTPPDPSRPQLPRTVHVRHGDAHFDEVGVFRVVCSGVAQLGGEGLGADGPHLTRLTHTFGGQRGPASA